MKETKKMPIAVLISGGGSTLKNLIDHAASGLLRIEIRLVISSSETARGIEFADAAGIPRVVIRKNDYASDEGYRDAIFDAAEAAAVQYVVMGGFLKHLLIPESYRNRVLNIHPSLIPSFSGKGFYGLKVHQAVIDYGAKITGCTVHFVDDQYDHGPVIAQSTCPVFDDDTVEVLQSRVSELERTLLPKVLNDLANDQIRISDDGRKITVEKL